MKITLPELSLVVIIGASGSGKSAFERVLFEFIRQKIAIVTTSNIEYNVRFENLPAGKFRHRDHRFEWTRTEFQTWAKGVAERFGFGVEFRCVGTEDLEVGSPTQMAIFTQQV
jgi:ABC-type proline/glycine betaine transport system ATPase subunit